MFHIPEVVNLFMSLIKLKRTSIKDLLKGTSVILNKKNHSFWVSAGKILKDVKAKCQIDFLGKSWKIRSKTEKVNIIMEF